ncbi:hypothetical protein POM88_020604 [Heracleum sosnowskyi]|uniref:Uncharacterized protein n=1 Tax=Heracleum sosnowskyi TaxID=360622 RepID=A0AAD8IBW5_9APIA|nr:hypothetical protein POM88_020604 [Heracleum sosnowskyi]
MNTYSEPPKTIQWFLCDCTSTICGWQEEPLESRSYNDKKEAAELETDQERYQRTAFAYLMLLKANERDVYEFFSKAGCLLNARLKQFSREYLKALYDESWEDYFPCGSGVWHEKERRCLRLMMMTLRVLLRGS